MAKQYIAINWNAIEDEVDKATWEKLTEQFWLDTRIPLSNDLDDWRSLNHDEQWVVGHVFGGLTLLDTLQSQDGMASLRQNIRTQQETAVLNNIQFMESVHAKSYSSIFSTLNTPAEIDEIFDWTNHNEHLQYKPTKLMIFIITVQRCRKRLPVFSWKPSCFIQVSLPRCITWATIS